MIHDHKENLLEPPARYFRFRKGIKSINSHKPITLVDLGCGPKIRFYYFAKSQHVKFKHYIGFDPLNKNLTNDPKVKLITKPILKKLNVASNSVDYVVGFAFLEHIDHPKQILNEAIRILKPGGIAIFTTPTFKAKKVLEFAAFRLNIISKREISEHKTYFNQKMLIELINDPSRVSLEHQYFEFGLNKLFVIKK